MHILWAYHSADLDDVIGMSKHTSRGARNLILLRTNQKPPELPPDAFYIDYLHDNVSSKPITGRFVSNSSVYEPIILPDPMKHCGSGPGWLCK